MRIIQREKRPRHKDTQGRLPCDKRGRDWSDESTSQGTPTTSSNHWKLGEKHGTDCPGALSNGTNLADPLILDSASSCERINCYCFKPLSLLYLLQQP